MISKVIKSEKEMARVAKRLIERIELDVGKRAVIVALEGPLGAGKTVLTKLMAREWGGQDEVVSPTYVLHIPHIIKRPEGRMQLEHIDAYRMEEWGEVLQIGVEKMIKNKAVVVIEWADKFRTEIKKLEREAKIVWIKIEYREKGNERKVSIS